jgi:excinuclease ABC subunit A
LCDPQIDEIQRAQIGITANTLDLKRGSDFYLAGQAWELCRAGKDRSLLFRFSGKWKGMPCIRGNLLHDLRALNKIELTPFDVWDSLSTRSETQLTVEDKTLLDRIAALTVEVDSHYDEVQALFGSLPSTRQVESRLRLLGLGASTASGSRHSPARIRIGAAGMPPRCPEGSGRPDRCRDVGAIERFALRSAGGYSPQAR